MEMEIGGGGGRRRLISRETSSDRAKLGSSQQQNQQKLIRPLRKVQIIYYLSRNGQLEHPHFMELPYLPQQQLRLKDVVDRLTALRGKGLPSLFSWSCKRSYKNGYVWNDLAENDVIHPADGVEYVLKGSEIIPGSSEKHLQPRTRRHKSLLVPLLNRQLTEFDDEEEEAIEEDEVEEEAVEEEEVRKGGILTACESNSRSDHSRCSRGVSTNELGRVKDPPSTRVVHHHSPTELPLDDASPPSSSSSDKPPNGVSGGGMSQRFEDGDPEVPGPGRNSVLLHLISCGSSAAKGKGCAAGGALMKAAAAGAAAVVASPLGSGRRSNGGFRRSGVSRLASRAIDQDEFRRVSENPRCGYPLVEDKEYFSGSIVEGSRSPTESSLKKSSSYNEERSSELGIAEAKVEEIEGERTEIVVGGIKGKCIPGMSKTSVKQEQ